MFPPVPHRGIYVLNYAPLEDFVDRCAFWWGLCRIRGFRTREAADAVWARWWGEHGTVPPFALSAGPFNTVCFIKDAGAGHPARDCSTAPQPLPPADFLAADVGTGNPGGMPFVTRSGAGLEVNGDRFVAVGPNCYWLGLDENVPANGSNVQYPTHFRVDDIFATAVEMGATTIRAHTLGVSTGNLKSFEPVEAVFDEHVAHGNDTSSASEHIDYAVYRARHKYFDVIFAPVRSFASRNAAVTVPQHGIHIAIYVARCSMLPARR